MEWMEFYFLKVNFAPSILKKGAYKHKTGRLKTSQNNLILISSIYKYLRNMKYSVKHTGSILNIQSVVTCHNYIYTESSEKLYIYMQS